MNQIAFPLEPGASGQLVTDLQDALHFLIDKGLLPLTEADRSWYSERLRAERATNRYTDITQKLVALFQERHNLRPSGAVDEPTARVLNAVLAEAAPTAPAAPDCQRLVGGRVLREDGRPFPGSLVRAFHVDDRGQLRLGEDRSDGEGRYTIRYAMLPGVSAVRLRVVAHDADGNLLGETELIRDPEPLVIVDLTVSLPERPPADVLFHVTGKVSGRGSAGVGGLQVWLVDKAVGEDLPLAETATDADGAYTVVFNDVALRSRDKDRPDLQARLFAGGRFLAASEVRYNASTHETLNILVAEDEAVAALQSEHETLTGALARHARGMLRDLQESEEQQDITYLANKTGWDARAVALAALADQFSARTATSNDEAIDPAFFYALFRSGLPANETAIYQTDAQVLAAVWTQAAAQGVIPAALSQRLPLAVEQFQRLAAQRALDAPALVGVSPLKAMLAVSLGDDAERHQRFAELYTRHQGDLPAFWQSVQAAFGEAAESRLRVDGQLAYLTLNNAPLMRSVHAAISETGASAALDLVAAGFHRTDRWAELVAGAPIPDEIPGQSEPEKRSRYAEMMAAQLRISFPTAVVAQMVKSGETPLAAEQAGERVYAFLTEHHGRFEIGIHPVEQYVARNQLELAPEVTREIVRIQRVHQITPSDQAMNALLSRGVDSAFAVTRYDREAFVESFMGEVGGEAEAALIHARAQQLHNAVLNIAVSYLTASNAPGIGVHSPAKIVSPAPTGPDPNTSDVIAYPALENLLGEMDYCACEHCRTILSPAAYLVDLLQFLDPPQVPAGSFNPQAVLFDRRPDIPHLPLTCENTNMPLPYIDLVNETLEYYVTNQLSLKDYAGHSTDGGAPAAELLANPQFVSEQAYTILAGKPAQPGDPAPLLPPAAPLPFHQPLEALRRHFDRLGAPLPAVMEALRQDDRLERASEAEYAWRDILMEELRLSRAEHSRLTDQAVTLQQLYGYRPETPDADMLADLSHAKGFTRRMGIAYEDLVAILKTGFVNPHSALIPKLERLGVPLATLKALKDGTITDAQFDSALAPHVDPAQYGGDIKAWVRDDANYSRVMGLLLLTNPDGPADACSFDKLQFRYADPARLAEPVRTFEFVRIFRFIRLWKKLGWSIAQTDAAITALYPPDQAPAEPDDAVNLTRLDAGFRTLLPRLGVLRRAITALNLKLSQDLEPLLACFAPVDTHGQAAAWLARQLKLSVRELQLLIQFSGIDPFAAPDPADPPLLRFIRLVGLLRTAGLKPSQALYLIWNQDMSGKSAPTAAEILGFARTLRTGFAAVESEFTLAVDPDGQGASAKMALVYGSEATGLFFGLLERKVVTDVPYSHADATLSQLILDAAAGAIAYDHLRKRLAYAAGVMPDTTRDALKRVAGVTPAFQAAVDALHTKSRSFFERYPELQARHDAYLASGDSPEQKRAALLDSLLPGLKRSRKRQQALQAMGAVVAAAAGLEHALLEDASVLHAAGDSTQPALQDLTLLETPAPGAVAGSWSGHLEAPEDGFYNFLIDAGVGATVTLTLGGATVPLAQSGTVWSNAAPIELRAGTLSALLLDVQNPTAPVTLRWETSGRGREVIPAQYRYESIVTSNLGETYVRFLKAASLSAALKLSAAELATLARTPDYAVGGQGWLNSLPVTGNPDQATAAALLTAGMALLDFARIKADLAPGDDSLLTILADPVAAAQHPDSLLFKLTRWEPASLNALLARFGKGIADLAHFETWRRIYDAYAWVTQLAIPATALITAATNEPAAAAVREFQAALRARYADSDWLNVVKPINDELRGLQRDALVAYILHQMRSTPASAHIDTPEKLFEYFLMDVQMEPCMQTSRIRHALSAVQLFIERCLMNLEPRVAPESINVKHWQWMSRYRVWEANRKVFLYPENWLEPELRDDQSPFFKDVMSELLQGDITEETGAVALLNYLAKLEEVAKLEPCGIHYAENDPTRAEDDVVHVVARTAGAHRKYFYRRREYGYWTPWDQIKLDIEDNPVIPVIWKNRLFIFWLRLLKEAPLGKPQNLSGSPASLDITSLLKATAPKMTVKAILCWSEYYNGKWQPTKTSDVNNAGKLDDFDPQAFDRSKLRLSVMNAGNALEIGVSGQGWCSFTLYNTHSLPVASRTIVKHSIITEIGRPTRQVDTDTDTLTMTYGQPIGGWSQSAKERQVLKNSLDDRAVTPLHPLRSPWDAPFLYEDSRHVFYVTTSERMVRISDWQAYVPIQIPFNPKLVVPQIVQPHLSVGKRLGPEPDPLAHMVKATGFAVADPAAMQRFVSEDAYISRGIGTSATVQFGSAVIGPAGRIGKSVQMP